MVLDLQYLHVHDSTYHFGENEVCRSTTKPKFPNLISTYAKPVRRVPTVRNLIWMTCKSCMCGMKRGESSNTEHSSAEDGLRRVLTDTEGALARRTLVVLRTWQSRRLSHPVHPIDIHRISHLDFGLNLEGHNSKLYEELFVRAPSSSFLVFAILSPASASCAARDVYRCVKL